MANENETVEEVCEELTIDGKAWFANRILAAHKREIEIASKYSAEHEARIFDALRKRDAIIKKLADALECAISGFSREVVTYGDAFALVKKAREVVK